MSVPYIPLYVADYEADTAHLTLEEDGAYMRLLRLCWRTPGCAIPDDPAWIMRRMRCSADEFHRVVRPVMDEFFSTEKARLFNPRLRAELERIEDTSRKRSAAGKMGGRPAKPLKKRAAGKSPAKANGKHLKPEPDPELERESNDSLEVEFAEWYSGYPRKVGKGQAEKAYRKARKSATRDELLSGLETFASAVAGKDPQYIPHASTWLNGERWLDEPETPHQPRTYADDMARLVGGDNVLRLEAKR